LWLARVFGAITIAFFAVIVMAPVVPAVVGVFTKNSILLILNQLKSKLLVKAPTTAIFPRNLNNKKPAL